MYEIAISEEQMIEYVKSKEKIYIYGAGINAKRVLSIMKRMDANIAGILVSSLDNNPAEIDNIPVMQYKKGSYQNSGIILGLQTKYIKEVLDKIEDTEDCLVIEDIQSIYAGLPKIIKRLPKLEISATMGCKIQCKYCPQKLLLQEYFKENKNRCTQMSLESYKRCIKNMPQETVITFSGFVEPFQHPEAVEMILYAHETGHRLELFTTLVGLTEEKFKRIEHIPFLKVELHTPDVYHYAKIKTDDSYWRVLDLVLDKRKENGQPFISSANCQSYPTEEFIRRTNGRIRVKSELVDRAGNLKGEELKSVRNLEGEIYCDYAFMQDHWVLLPDGTVTLCCMDFGLRHPLGNLCISTYDEIRREETYLNIRRAMMNMNADNHILCRQCTVARRIIR